MRSMVKDIVAAPMPVVFYAVFPPDEHAGDVLSWLSPSGDER
jgi:hypothetical protein